MTTKTKRKPKTSKPAKAKTAKVGRPSFRGTAAQWAAKQVTAKLKTNPEFAIQAAKDMELPLLDQFSKAKLAAIAEASGVELPPKRERTAETMAAAIMAGKKLVIPAGLG